MAKVTVDTVGTPGETFLGYKIHPAANVFPMIDKEQLQELADDIEANGLVEPIILYDDQVLDGRNRLAACAVAGVTPTFTRLSGDDVDSPATFVVSLNVRRRMLSASQRAAIALTLESMFQEEARQRSLEGARRGGQVTAAKRKGVPVPEFSAAPKAAPKTGKTKGAAPEPFARKSESTRSRDKSANLMSVSSGYVGQAKKIVDEAPELAEELRAGTITIPEAKRQVFPKLDAIKKKTPEKAKPRKIDRPKNSKVSSSRVTLRLTVTFGSPEVAQKVLQGLDDDKRVLAMDHETVDTLPEKKSTLKRPATARRQKAAAGRR